jgi:hypothetical protein
MPTPTVITDLSTTAASNFPAGSDAPSTIDDTLRAHGAFIAQLRDGPHVPSLGSAGAPAYAFVGDTNTGAFSPSADLWAVSIAGTERLRVTSTAIMQDTSVELGWKDVRVSSQTGGTLTTECRGKQVQLASDATLNTAFSAGDSFKLVNISGSAKSVIQGGSATMYLASSGGTGTRSLANGGMASVLCVGTNTYIIDGGGLS